MVMRRENGRVMGGGRSAIAPEARDVGPQRDEECHDGDPAPLQAMEDVGMQVSLSRAACQERDARMMKAREDDEQQAARDRQRRDHAITLLCDTDGLTPEQAEARLHDEDLQELFERAIRDGDDHATSATDELRQILHAYNKP
jgi:hypothetical protein